MAAAVILVAGCSGGAAPSASVEPPPISSPPPPTASSSTAPSAPTPAATAPSGPIKPHACKLDAPVKSGDACKIDADCGVASPCHARACVAKAKARPRTPDVMCTEMLDCASADVNHCGCVDGVCALAPPP
jgi:hypothetical protein